MQTTQRRHALSSFFATHRLPELPYLNLKYTPVARNSIALSLCSCMGIPETTSAEGFERFVGGKCLNLGKGEAWREIKAWIVAPPRESVSVPLPGVSEPFLAWVVSGDLEFREREGEGPWISNHINRGSFFLTDGGAPYEVRWKCLTPEPFLAMSVFIEIPLLERAMSEVYGEKAKKVRLKDLSGFKDPALHSLMERLHAELLNRKASPLYVQGLAQAITVHLVRHYTQRVTTKPSGSPSLPGFKLKQITDWMSHNLAEEFSLEDLAAKVKLSKFHFLRLFKNATGMSPSRYHTRLRIEAAKRGLRESNRSVVEVGLDLGYGNPSHFAQVFKRETGLSPSDYRRQR